MGQEINSDFFSDRDFALFSERLRTETEWLRQCFATTGLSAHAPVGGFELEAWLLDDQAMPAPRNLELLERLDPALFTAELARFNIEINNPPHALQKDFFSHLLHELSASWAQCRTAAAELGLRMAMIGILPTAEQAHFNHAAMSPLKRFQAINREIFRQRQSEPIKINILGADKLALRHNDVMLEAATTSLQLHLQVPGEDAVGYYNAALIAAAPVLAAATNSPYLFGRQLWEETRIPLFEQAIAVGGYAGALHGPLQRVSFGSGYARQSLFEAFEENLQHFPPLLPMLSNTPKEALAHLRLHNGTIWRWNRPLLGWDTDGKLHLRIEHRSIPGGPTVIDMIANAALFYGLCHYLSHNQETDYVAAIPFASARDNFYAAARAGLKANLVWCGGRHWHAERLLLDELIHLARQGLHDLNIQQGDIDTYLGIIEARVQSGQSGSIWQKRYVQTHGADMRRMTLAYLERQQSGDPVHTWSL